MQVKVRHTALGQAPAVRREAAQNSATALASAEAPCADSRPGFANGLPMAPYRSRHSQAGQDNSGRPDGPGAGSRTFTATKNKDNSYRKKVSGSQAEKRKHNI